MKIWFTVLVLLLARTLAAQTVTLQWDLSADDAKLGDGGGYRTYAGKTAGGPYNSLATVLPGVNTVTVVVPTLGKTCFVESAFAADLTESPYSNEVCTVIKPRPPKLNTVQQVAQVLKNVVVKVAGLFRKHQNLRIVEVG